MSDDELLVKTLNNILKNLEEEKKDVEQNYDLSDDFNKELLDEYNDYVQIIEGIIPKINCIDDLYEKLDEDEFTFILENIENYAEIFILDGRNIELLSEQEKEYSQLCDILFEFYDDDDSNDESDE